MSNKACLMFEVASSGIKLLEAEIKKDKILVSKYSKIPLPENSVTRGIVTNTDAVALAIKTEMSKKAFKIKRARTVISGEGIIFREVLIKKVSEKELANIVRYEADQYFPVDLSSYAVDYKVMGEVETNDGPKFKVQVIAVPQKFIDDSVEIAEKAGLLLEVIDINSNTFSKLLACENKAQSEEFGNQVVIGIDIGATASYIIFLQNGIFQFGREVKFGCYEIINALSEYLGISKVEAEELFKTDLDKYLYINENDTSLDEEIRFIGKDINKLINIFLLELTKIIEFYQARHVNESIQKMFISGGGANMPGIDQYISKVLNMDCKLLKNLKCVEDATKQNFGQITMSMTNLLGLAIRSK